MLSVAAAVPKRMNTLMGAVVIGWLRRISARELDRASKENDEARLITKAASDISEFHRRCSSKSSSQQVPDWKIPEHPHQVVQPDPTHAAGEPAYPSRIREA